CEIADYDVLLSDTVGFIRKLPHDLIESFKSTLDEVRAADILLHVTDASALMIEDYIEVVNETLEDMGAAEDKKSLLVFNKIDTIAPIRTTEINQRYPDAIFISPQRGSGLVKMEEQIKQLIDRDYVTETMHIPAAKYEGVGFLHREPNI